MTELFVKLDRGTRTALHVQIEAQLREAIRSGRLAAGAEMPSTRSLAVELAVSRGVVVESYAQLQAEGYLQIMERSRTVVAEAGAEGEAEPSAALDPAPPRWDFHPGYPDLDGFPRSGWSRAYRNATKDLPGRSLAYGDLRGALALRTALAGHLGRSRAVSVGPERVLICQGVQHGLGLLCRVLAERGARRVAVEDPCLQTHVAVIRSAGLETVPIAVDEDGMRVGELESAAVEAVLVTPAHQFPMGSVLSPQRRSRLVEWARRSGGFVIEDDYDAEYRYDREPVGSLQGLAPEQVAYAGSTSKILAPGLRVGWMAIPEALHAATLGQKALADGVSPIFEQLTLAEFIETEAFYRHLRRMRRLYRRRRDAMVAALAKELPEARVRGVAAGLHVLAILPAGSDEDALAAAALGRGVNVHALGWHRAAPKPEEPGLVLGYASQPERAIAQGIGELALALGSG